MFIKHFDKKIRRHRRVSLNIRGNGQRPRIALHRSGRYIYAQAIDDDKRMTLAAFSSLKLRREKAYQKTKKSDEARLVGQRLAALLQGKKISRAVFDRAGYPYLGRVKSVAEGIREGKVQI
ncbi:50S ribosomal protein L18 [Patescibacteria group bacterium]|nr:50S ribosomal protein L18 [Patescibacteria group bacterium]MCL5091685.1 50S ribosomal protein L18 [Patescibacteria group bacterium]